MFFFALGYGWMDGCNNVWLGHPYPSTQWLKNKIKLTGRDQYVQDWYASLRNSSKASCYALFKSEHQLEKYFTMDIDAATAKSLCRFRLSNHYLPIEIGRWGSISRQSRFCPLCTANVIGNETHYILDCQFFEQERAKLIPTFILNYSTGDRDLAMKILFQSVDKEILINLGIFCHLVMECFKQL